MTAEPRQATVLFADIAGFTAMSEQLDPEAVTDAMNRCFESIEGVVIAHGGAVAQYLGDCTLAVFHVADDGAARACAAIDAALEIRSTIQRLNRELKLPGVLDVHVGVATGTVTGGAEAAGGPAQTLAGEAVGRAAQLEDRSETGQILIDASTHAVSADAFHVRAFRAGAEAADHTHSAFEVLAASDARVRIKRQSERRQAAVLFAKLSTAPDAPRAVEVVERCLDAFEETVRVHGGVVDKYMGESAMALFGVPNAIENAAQEAVNAAIELRNRVGRIAADPALGPPPALHVGVNAGLVVAGEIGGRVRREYTVMGDTVNLAARLKERAPAGAIWVGAEVYRQTRAAFAYDPLPPLRVKGKSEPVQPYAVLSDHEQLHRAADTTAARLTSALIGRERELHQLREAFEHLWQGRGAVVSVVGEAGVGKSRLLAEVLSDRRLRQATVLEGRATSMGENLSYHPFVDMLRRWAALPEDDAVAARRRLEEAVSAALGALAAEDWPLIATLMGMELSGADAERVAGIDGEALERLIAKSVRDLLCTLAEAAPLIIVLEDLHWADQSSLRLLTALLRLVTEHRILIIPVFRPDYRETAEGTVAEGIELPAAWHRQITVAALTEQQSTVLIENLLQIDDLPLAARRLITQKAEGNPFYIEEVIRSLIDQRAIERRGSRYVFTAALESVRIPGTIQEVIMTRVDHLDDATRHLLQVASVIGRSFYRPLIGEILRRQGYPRDQEEQALALLTEKQLLAPRPMRWTVAVDTRDAAAELEYLFTHALAQQTIYESLLQKTRREFHGIVAAVIESVFADRLPDFFGMLAYHYSRAEELVKAEEYLFKAGEIAARSAASREALNFFQEASRLYLQLHPDGGDAQKRLLLEKRIAVALWNVGDLDGSIEQFDKTLAQLGERVPSSSLSTNLRFASDFAALLYRLYRGPAGDRRDLERVREIVSISYMKGRAQTTSDPVRVFMDSVHGMRWLNRSDPTRIDQAAGMYATMAAFLAYSGLGASMGVSFALCRRCLGLAERALRPGSVPDQFAYQCMRFIGDYLAGEWQRIETIDEALCGAALQHGLLWDLQTYLGLESERLLRQGRFADSEQSLAQLEQMAERFGYEFAEATHLGVLAMLEIERRRLDDALAVIERYRANRHEPPLLLYAHSQTAKVHLLQGNQALATAALADASEVLRRSPVIPPLHLNFHAITTLLHDVVVLGAAQAAGEPARRRRVLAAQAKRSARRALQIASQVRTQRTEVFALAGRLYWTLRRERKACQWWTASVREGQRIGARPELARAYLTAATQISSRGALRVDGLDAAGLARRARELFAELGLDEEREQGTLVTRAA
jgi:class 3 adenylate cyclase/tetratricopeptide (TPR) repeat protein